MRRIPVTKKTANSNLDDVGADLTAISDLISCVLMLVESVVIRHSAPKASGSLGFLGRRLKFLVNT